MAAYKTILIAGPTGSGKSNLAVELAKRHHGVIINTDSMQVYRELRIVTARPTLEDELEAPHQLYGFVEARDVFSAGAWLRYVANLLPELRAEFETLIFVGGTGLYFNALTAGLSEIPETPNTLRQSLRDELKMTGPAALYAQLQTENAGSAAGLNPSDGQRIVRALEVLRHTGRPLHIWQRQNSTPLVDLDASSTTAIILDPPRELLSDRIAKRFHKMVEMGAIEEVAVLLNLKLDHNLPAMKAIGVKQLGSYLAGEVPLGQAVELSIIASRQYAKRQRTWFAGQMGARWQRFPDFSSAFAAI